MYAGREHKLAVSRVIQQSASRYMNHANREARSNTKRNLSFNPFQLKNKVAQRLVGLEFESSNLKVRGHKKDYKTIIAKGEGFDVTIDYGNVEIVTKAFQASEKEQLKQAVQNSVDGIKKLRPYNVVRSFPNTNETLLKGLQIIKKDPVKAHPQATMGIPLNALYSVYEMLSQQQPNINLSNRNVELPHFSLQQGKHKKWEPMRKHMQIMIEEVNKEERSPKLKGLYAQVLTTINSINDSEFQEHAKFNDRHNVWKNEFVLMPRTKLSHLYNLLDEDDKQQFKSWVETIDNKKKILDKITISEWLKGIVGLETKELATEDLQIESLGSDKLNGITKPKDIIECSMKAMNESINSIPTNINTRDNPVNEGGIFEFRHLKGNVPLEEWPLVAEEAASVAEWVEEIRLSPQTVQSEGGSIFNLTECASSPSN